MTTIRLTQPRVRDRSAPEAAGIPRNAALKGGQLYLYSHPLESWYWTAKPGPDGERLGWLPRLLPNRAQPGVNGVSDPGKGKEMTRQHLSRLLAGLNSRGDIVIMPEDQRLGPYRYYDRYYEIQGGGRYYVEPGQTCSVLANGKVIWNSDDVGDHILEFHRYVRDNAPGLLNPLMRETVQAHVTKEQERLSRYIDAAAKTPGLGHRIEPQQQKIEWMWADYERYEAALLAHEGGGQPLPLHHEPAPDEPAPVKIGRGKKEDN